MVEKLLRVARLHCFECQPLLFGEGIVVWIPFQDLNTGEKGLQGFNVFSVFELSIVLGY
jgi:hypothetical protein